MSSDAGPQGGPRPGGPGEARPEPTSGTGQQNGRAAPQGGLAHPGPPHPAPYGPAPYGPPLPAPPHGPPPQPAGPFGPPPGWVPPPPPTAEEMTDEGIVRARPDAPTMGWQRLVHAVTGGLVSPRPGVAEIAHRTRLHRIRRPLGRPRRVAVSSLKGGVGKTTVATCLGLVLAEYRGDRVVALDANPDAGTLADRLTGESAVTVRDLLTDLDRIESWTDMSRYTSLAGRLQVLASEQDPAASEAFSRVEYERVCAVLERYFNIIVTDSGTGLVHSAMEGTLALADGVIIVGAPTVDGAGRASKTLDWLVAHTYGRLVEDAIVVLSCDRRSPEVDLERVRRHFAARCRAVVEIPHDPHLATGGRVDLGRLRPATRESFHDLAALVADGFAGP